MRRTLLLAVLSFTVSALTAPIASAQPAPNGPLSARFYLQLKPGELPAFEEARMRAIEHRRENGFRWNEFVVISENNVVRITAQLPNGWSDVAAQREWFASNPGNSGMADTAARIWNDISQSRPELSHQPDNPRVAQGDFGFIRELRVYMNPGQGSAVIEFTEAIRDAFQAAGSDQPRFVASGVVGGRGPSISVFYPARDAADYYTNRESLQPIFDSVRSQRTPGAVQRTETINWTRRRDLDFSVDD